MLENYEKLMMVLLKCSVSEYQRAEDLKGVYALDLEEVVTALKEREDALSGARELVKYVFKVKDKKMYILKELRSFQYTITFQWTREFSCMLEQILKISSNKPEYTDKKVFSILVGIIESLEKPHTTH